MEENVKAVLQRIPENQLHTFNNHPFTVRRDEAMEKLVDSVRVNGILNPILVRPRPDGEYEIIAGHRRTEAGRILKLPYIPCFVCELDDDHAIIAMIDSNLSQRENLPPSERAFALRMKTEAARRIMLATKGRSEVKRASENVAKDSGMSARQVERFIKLTELNRQLLNLLDAGKLGTEVCIELAHLSTVEQCWIFDYITEHNMTLSFVQVKRLRQAIQQEGAVEKDIGEILAASARPAKKNKTPSPTVAPAKEPSSEIVGERDAPFGEQSPKEGKPVGYERSASSPAAAPQSMLDSDMRRIVEMYPPDTPSDVICDNVCRVLEVTRGFRKYYPPGLPDETIFNDIGRMLEVKRPKQVYTNTNNY